MSVTDLATEYAALNAIGAGVAGRMKVVAEEIVTQAVAFGTRKGELPTALGPVTLAANNGSRNIIITDSDALLGWCEINLPSAIIRPAPVINQQSKEQLLTERFKEVDGRVIDTSTGEVILFARVNVVEDGPPTVRYGASAVQEQVKAAAAKVVTARSAELMTTIIAAHEMAKAIEAGIDE